jgi:hypothetical protein
VRELVCNALLEEPALLNCTIGADTPGHVDVFRQPVSGRSGEITVQVQDGVVTLNGQVPSLSHKRLTGVLAWWVPGTRDVINGLEETPPKTTMTMKSPKRFRWFWKKTLSLTPVKYG